MHCKASSLILVATLSLAPSIAWGADNAAAPTVAIKIGKKEIPSLRKSRSCPEFIKLTSKQAANRIQKIARQHDATAEPLCIMGVDAIQLLALYDADVNSAMAEIMAKKKEAARLKDEAELAKIIEFVLKPQDPNDFFVRRRAEIKKQIENDPRYNTDEFKNLARCILR